MTPIELLAFEARGWRHAGRKELAITTELGLTPVSYYRQLLAAAHDPAGMAAHPAVAARVRRLAQPAPARSHRRWATAAGH